MSGDFEWQHPRGKAGKFRVRELADPGAQVLTETAGTVQRLARGSLADRLRAARAEHLTEDQAAVLAEDNQPFAVRFMVCGRSAATAARAARDRDPVIRLRALQSGLLSAADAADLADDPAVKTAARVFGHAI